jgi:hypothetical protein
MARMVRILPAFRGHGLGHRLYLGAAKSGLALVTLTMALATRHMAERLGAIALPRMRQWSRIEAPTGRDSLSGREDSLPAKLGARGEAREPPRRVVGARFCGARGRGRGRPQPTVAAGCRGRLGLHAGRTFRRADRNRLGVRSGAVCGRAARRPALNWRALVAYASRRFLAQAASVGRISTGATCWPFSSRAQAGSVPRAWNRLLESGPGRRCALSARHGYVAAASS